MSDRITRDDMLMSMAIVASQRGTCSRLRVGAIVSRRGRIISTGYNGAPSGLAHCEHWDDTPETSCTIAEHAERNAIAFAARYGVALEGAEMHTTHAPCIDCARSIINSGIQIVKFKIPYRLTAGVDLLRRAGLAVVDMSRTAG